MFYRSSAIVLYSICLFNLIGCGGYGEVGIETYKYASAIYSICNARDSQRLEEFESKLQGDLTVSEREKKWVMDLVEMAESGQWEQAATKARRMMSDQVKEE